MFFIQTISLHSFFLASRLFTTESYVQYDAHDSLSFSFCVKTVIAGPTEEPQNVPYHSWNGSDMTTHTANTSISSSSTPEMEVAAILPSVMNSPQQRYSSTVLSSSLSTSHRRHYNTSLHGRSHYIRQGVKDMLKQQAEFMLASGPWR